MKEPLYRTIQNDLKFQIQRGVYKIGDYLPSENELCATYKITRTTARKALDELFKDGFIQRQHGKGRGFSEAVGKKVETLFLQVPGFRDWISNFPFIISEKELENPCIHFERLRSVDGEPIMLENNWFSSMPLTEFIGMELVEGSFFKTLSQNYQIEIIGSEHARK